MTIQRHHGDIIMPLDFGEDGEKMANTPESVPAEFVSVLANHTSAAIAVNKPNGTI